MNFEMTQVTVTVISQVDFPKTLSTAFHTNWPFEHKSSLIWKEFLLISIQKAVIEMCFAPVELPHKFPF